MQSQLLSSDASHWDEALTDDASVTVENKANKIGESVTVPDSQFEFIVVARLKTGIAFARRDFSDGWIGFGQCEGTRAFSVEPEPASPWPCLRACCSEPDTDRPVTQQPSASN
jgi:hypothetical protein